jgi:hypothetical protein
VTTTLDWPSEVLLGDDDSPDDGVELTLALYQDLCDELERPWRIGWRRPAVATAAPDYETAWALLQDVAEDATRELAAIRWRHDALRAAGPFAALLLDPVTSTTDEVCDHLLMWARTRAEVVASFGLPEGALAPPLADMLAGIERARAAYA